MSHLSLDAKVVLMHLNALGYRNISSEQLKEFIKDLKKLIKYDMKMEAQGFRVAGKTTISSRSKGATKTQLQRSSTDEENFLNIRSTRLRSKSDRDRSSSKSQRNIKNTEDLQTFSNKEAMTKFSEKRKFLPESGASHRSRSPQSTLEKTVKRQSRPQSRESARSTSLQSAHQQTDRKQNRPQSRASARSTSPPKTPLTSSNSNIAKVIQFDIKSMTSDQMKEFLINDVQKTQTQESSRKIDDRDDKISRQSVRSASSGRSKMWIRSQKPQKPVTGDPVALYQYYKKEWEKFKPNLPGENSWSDLRWEIRNKLQSQR